MQRLVYRFLLISIEFYCMKKQIVVALIASCLAIFSAKASITDTTLVSDDMIYLNFDSNLDSLLNRWNINNGPLNKTYTKSPLTPESILDAIPDSVYISRLGKIPTTVKLSYNNIVRNNINFYLSRRKAKVEELLGLANFYFPVFDDIFDIYKVPNEMKYMSIIESALNPKAYSRTRAVGLWQFMYGTGKLYGLEVNSYVDERRDLMKSTHAACRFVNDLYKIYGDWILVIAAYNCGPGNVNKAIRRAGGKRNYWDIYYFLPKETRGHVPAFIAATYMMHYYKEHNLQPRQSLLPVAVDTVMVSEDLHFAQVSEVLNIPIQELRDINLQYIRDIIPGRIKPYPLYLPQEYTAKFIQLEDSIFNYKDSLYFDKRFLTHSPGNGDNSRVTDKRLAKRLNIKGSIKKTHRVHSGETLGEIAKKYNVTVSDLKAWNKIKRKNLVVGQKLVVYLNEKESKDSELKQLNHKTNKKNKETSDDEQNIKNNLEKEKTIKKEKKTSKANDVFLTYKVKKGQTLYAIAKVLGVTANELKEWNAIDGSNIKVGQKLKYKKSE